MRQDCPEERGRLEAAIDAVEQRRPEPRLDAAEPAGGRGLIDAEADDSGEVSRGNVALVVAQTLIEPATIGRTIRFNDGTVPIAEALRG